MRDHTKLKAFQIADDLALATYEGTQFFPDEERFGLTAQMRKAAVSVPSNIVEGCARHSEKDFLRFLDMAYASAKELEYQCSLAKRLGFFPGDEYREMESLCDESARILNGLIRAIRNT